MIMYATKDILLRSESVLFGTPTYPMVTHRPFLAPACAWAWLGSLALPLPLPLPLPSPLPLPLPLPLPAALAARSLSLSFWERERSWSLLVSFIWARCSEMMACCAWSRS